MPEIGENVTEATIVYWLKEEEEFIEKDDVLLEIMTDKINKEIESPVSGIVKEIFFPEETVVKIGETIASIEEGH